MGFLLKMVGCIVWAYIAYHLSVDEDRPEHLIGGSYEESDGFVCSSVADCDAGAEFCRSKDFW